MKALKSKILAFFKHLTVSEIKSGFKDLLFNWILGISSFTLLLLVYLIGTCVKKVGSNRFFPKFITSWFTPFLKVIYLKIVNLTGSSKGTISRIDLIELAIRNMSFKKNRSVITIGGMALGIGAIVFLVSLGYGVNKLVVDKVARLEELQQTDVTPQTGSNIKLNALMVKDMQNMKKVELVLPQIAVVAKVNYQNSVSDMAVYGVTTNYLQQTAIKTIAGKLFENNELDLDREFDQLNLDPKLATGSSSVLTEGRYLEDTLYQIKEYEWLEVRSQPNAQGQILGYTKRVADKWQTAAVVLAESYFSQPDSSAGQTAQDIDGVWLGKWIRDDFDVYQQQGCGEKEAKTCTSADYQPMLDENKKQITKQGYIKFGSVDTQKIEKVLGQTTQVATTSAQLGDKSADVEYEIYPESWLAVRETADQKGKIVGYTKRAEGNQVGEEIWGSEYLADSGAGQYYNPDTQEMLGKWIQAPVSLWKKIKCDPTQIGCYQGKYQEIVDEAGLQMQFDGYLQEQDLKVIDVSVKYPTVLGTSIDTEDYVLGDSDDLLASKDDFINQDEWVEIASEAGIVAPPEKQTIKLPQEAQKEAVVNVSMLKILGLTADQAIGGKFDASFVVVGDLLDTAYQVESESVTYTIVGVVPEDKAPFFYVPFNNLRQLGIKNFSQVKIVVKDQNDLAQIRNDIESKGFNTTSVVDTVAQIDSLFSTARSLLALLGMVALAVASLGMFNTLTVSLLERTREVGLMKAMGMKSHEVRELFLTESMIMGFFGGLFGILLGFSAGKLLGVFLSIFSLTKGQGIIDISYIPFMFIAVVFSLSLTVGILTGIYPAKRATKISALNALRYE